MIRLKKIFLARFFKNFDTVLYATLSVRFGTHFSPFRVFHEHGAHPHAHRVVACLDHSAQLQRHQVPHFDRFVCACSHNATVWVFNGFRAGAQSEVSFRLDCFGSDSYLIC